jgi:hypothetical protein
MEITDQLVQTLFEFIKQSGFAKYKYMVPPGNKLEFWKILFELIKIDVVGTKKILGV